MDLTWRTLREWGREISGRVTVTIGRAPSPKTTPRGSYVNYR